MLRGDIVKVDSGAHAVFTEQGSSASQMAAAKVMDVIANYLIVQDKPPTQYPLTPMSKYGGRFKVAQNAKVRVSRYMDTSSTTQVAQIMVKHRRPRGSSRPKIVRTPACRPLVGTRVRRNSVGTWMGKSTELGMCFCSPEPRIVLICIRG